MKAIYGLDFDENKLDFILACRCDGYYSKNPSRRRKVYLKEICYELKAPPKIVLKILVEMYNQGLLKLSYSMKHRDHVVFSVK
mgnify:CR=1 FL=1